MIHHISIPAKNPLHVAEVLSELFNGYCAPFQSHPGSYVAFAADKYGTLIEVYPLDTQMIPGEEDKPIQYQNRNSSNQFIATHAAISIPLNQSQIELIAKREKWRSRSAPHCVVAIAVILNKLAKLTHIRCK
ncbi:MAG: hypothetical protein QNJ70_13935 [Xenococcaceae cyanobacterium MO_207.B15]|nr:hypothetical protein [Xenococcaceae cyanobacterium MO_207.B15]